MAHLPQELQAYADNLLADMKRKTQAYVKKAMQLHKQGPPPAELSPEIAQPITGRWPFYPWWNIFLVGPIQVLGPAHAGPFRPSKIISYENDAYMLAFVWRNPVGVNWDSTAPSACQLLNGRKFQINFEVVNLTSVSEGPDLEKIEDAFPNAPDCIQLYARKIENFPKPDQGKPHLYNLYATIDITEAEQPMAGFATWIYDPDIEPRWWFFPTVYPQYQYDQPAQFMVFQR